MKRRDKLSILQRIYNIYGSQFQRDVFSGSFHNLLWQILVNENTKGKDVTFYVNVEDGYNQIVLACSTGGYIETGVNFVNGNWDFCQHLCKVLSKRVFNNDETTHEKIISQSFGMAV